MSAAGSNDNITDAIDEICSKSSPQRDIIAIYCVVISIVIFFNGLLLIGIGISWRTLRQNSIHYYLISCSFSAIFFCFSIFYEVYYTTFQVDNASIEGGVLQRYNVNISSHRNAMQHYAFRKGLLASMWLVMELNVVALIFAVGDNAQFIGRYTEPKLPSRSELAAASRDGRMKKKRGSEQKMFKGKRFKAFVLSTMAWIIPILLSVAVALGWNCVEYCACLPGIRSGYQCTPPEDSGHICSRQWLPMSQSFIIVLTVLYLCGFVVIFGMLTSTIRKFYRSHAPRRSKVNFTESKRKRIGEVNAMGRRNSNGGFVQASGT
uniref:uncharacterized protein LOC120332935 n=1 Tax=Styela clava TaxID=7725 RepID=UPI00193A9235|nr:uncharacterized protein LOC120332935 [Styela clava]